MPNLKVADNKILTMGKTKDRKNFPVFFYLCARQGAPTWRCRSSTRPTGGSVSLTARVLTARWDLKEAAGKALARRTGIAYEEGMLDEKANIFKVRYLYELFLALLSK